ncbi:MAG: acyltransferase family protein [Sphingomonas sp.]|jgi:peptidoglycan/LPS O-acetylase OafA/YrhL|uniref:acyltransferase family protein n=1 Tax=Sphingomonas sp. TaxID=28214 RepID=UPI003569010D
MNIERPQERAASRSRVSYRPEIDGLRAVAVAAVLLFHFDRSLLPGGFVGVDIFFVISGFLISSILLSDISNDRFSLGRFYQRRISRIFPAALLVILVTTLAASQIYSDQDLASLGVTAAAAAVSLINFKLLSQHGYFVMSADAQPLLHYWSLAVEEQFYLVFPLLLWLLMRFVARPLRAMFCMTVLSYVLCGFVTAYYPTIAFYMLPTRAWELLAGSCLALYVGHGAHRDGTSGWWAPWAGLALIVLSVFVIDEASRFPGWLAALPVLGAVLLIAPTDGTKFGPVKLLAQPAMVAIGVRSYSLYLWHWPVFSLVDYQFFQDGDLLRAVLKVGLTMALTECSYRFVETPARIALNSPARRWYVFAGAFALVGAIGVAGFQMRSSLYFDVPPGSIAAGGKVVSGGSGGKVLLSGDSEAAMYGAELGSLARERAFTLYAVGVAGQNELPGADQTLWPSVETLIAQTKPDVVVLINDWSAKLTSAEPLRQAIAFSLAHARRVVIVTQPPILPDNVSREAIRAGLRGPFREPPDQARRRMAANAIIESFQSERVIVVEAADNFLAPDGSIRIVDADRRMTFKDARHLSNSGTLMARQELGAALGHALAIP